MLALLQRHHRLLHAPRQTGKTSALLALMEHLNAQGTHRCVYINVEVGQAAREDVGAAMQAILGELARLARMIFNDSFVDDIWGESFSKHRMRTDLLVLWPYPGGVQKVVIELKILYKSLEQTIAMGLEQTWASMDWCATHAGHLVIFDRTPGKPWEEKVWHRQKSVRGHLIHVWGM